MGRRILVSGATGTVGRYVVKALEEQGHAVLCGSRDPAQAQRVLDGAEVCHLDLSADEHHPALFDDVDGFFMMNPLIEDPRASAEALLDAAAEAGVPRIVRLSARSAAWDQQSVLRSWQRDIDDMVQAQDCAWTVLRPCSFFQNFVKFQRKSIKDFGAITVPQGEGLISYIDARDIGEAAAHCLTSERGVGEVLTLTGPRAYGVRGVAAEIGRVIHKPLMYIDVEPVQVRSMLLEGGQPEWLVEAALAVFAHAREGLEAQVDPALTTLLGRPGRSLSEFVEDHRQSWL